MIRGCFFQINRFLILDGKNVLFPADKSQTSADWFLRMIHSFWVLLRGAEFAPASWIRSNSATGGIKVPQLVTFWYIAALTVWYFHCFHGRIRQQMCIIQVFSFTPILEHYVQKKSFHLDYSGKHLQSLWSDRKPPTFLFSGFFFSHQPWQCVAGTHHICRSIRIWENVTDGAGSQKVVRTGQQNKKPFLSVQLHGCSSSFPSLVSLQRFISLPSVTLQLPAFVSQELPGIHLEEMSFPKSTAAHRLSADSLRWNIQSQPIITRPPSIPKSVPDDCEVIVP